MDTFWLITLLAAVVWLIWHSRKTKAQMEELDSRMASLEDKIRSLQSETRPQTLPATPPRLPSQLIVPAPPVTRPLHPELPPIVPEPIPVLKSVGEPIATTISSAPPLIQEKAAGRGAAPIADPGPPPATLTDRINWEKFLGVNLFAWVGGLALFLGVAFFLKYSFEKNLITPAMRIAIGFVTGIGLLIGGLWLPRQRHTVTVQTLCATGIMILYANLFAAHSYYHFLSATPTFLLMILVTVTAFLLAVRLDAQVVAVLGLAGGFLTPPMLSTGVDKAVALFSYIALLNIGLLSVVFRKRWTYLALLGGLATILMQIGWVMKFFEAEKIWVALGIFFGFTVLFVSAFALAHRFKTVDKWISAAAILLPMTALAFAFFLMARPYTEICQRPVLLFGFVFVVDLGLIAVGWLRDELRPVHLGAGLVVFSLLALWTLRFVSSELLNAALGFYFLFAILHAVPPVILQRLRPTALPFWWVHFYPALALLLIMVPLVKTTALTLLLWPMVLLIDLVAIVLAVLTASLVSILAVFVLTVLATALWIFRLPPALPEVPGMLVVIGGFAVFFMLAGLLAGRRIFGKLVPAPNAKGSQSTALELPGITPEMCVQIASFAAMLPFLLLTLVVLRLPLANPSPVFGLAALLLVLMLGALRFYQVDLLAAVGLVSVLLLEHAWHLRRYAPDQAGVALAWYLGFGGLFLVFPFLFQTRMETRIVPWLAAALAFPAHFWLIYHVVDRGYPNSYMGLVPALLALPLLAGLLRLIRRVPSDGPQRNTLLALFGGATLFFITLIFPIQFERQWITIGWALEGVALLWLFHRVPHPGLRLAGAGLLVASFVRLALNPAVLTYHARSDAPIFNWFLYAYGIVTLCLFVGAKLLAPPRHLIQGTNAPPVLYTLGAILAFLLLNIEIADYFSAGRSLTFHFSGNFAQDMTYSLAWGIFAFALLAVGFKFAQAATRYAGMGLMVVTLLKLFLHDLWRLGGLYRIGSLIGLAVVLILISFIYQRFLSSSTLKKNLEEAAERKGR